MDRTRKVVQVPVDHTLRTTRARMQYCGIVVGKGKHPPREVLVWPMLDVFDPHGRCINTITQTVWLVLN